MAHDFVKDMIDAEEGWAETQIGVILVGAVLLLTSIIADLLFTHPFYAGSTAMAGAILLGAPLVWQALRDLRRGSPEMNELAALGVVAAFVSGEYLTAGSISFFMFISTFIEYRSALGARKNIESLIRLSPSTARRVINHGEEVVEASLLSKGDLVRVRPGDNIPGDGLVSRGQSTVNQASITGESLPVEKKAGDEVFAGSINLTGLLEVKIRKTGEDTTLGQIRNLIVEAEASRTPVMRLIDRYAKWYTPLILMLAGAVLFFTRDVERAVAMLVISCPCAIILSAPTATVAALSAAARLGVLIKNVSDLEVARHLSAVVFDKTGTLTMGKLRVARMRVFSETDEAGLLTVAARLEGCSNHPVAKAVFTAASRQNLDCEGPVDNFEESPGKGVRGSIDGREILVGRRAWLEDHNINVDESFFKDGEGLSLLFVAEDGKPLGWLGLEDQIRTGAAYALTRLEAEGVKKRIMLTGDRWSVAKRVADKVGCSDVMAEVFPNEKMHAVHSLKKRGHIIAVVGDGVNDAPALAAGDISIAMGAAGSDVAIHSASIALMNNELNRIPFLFHLSRRTVGVIQQNMFFSISFIIVLFGLSAAGFVHPVLAVLLHTASALAVILNSARLIREGENMEDHETAENESIPAQVPLVKGVRAA